MPVPLPITATMLRFSLRTSSQTLERRSLLSRHPAAAVPAVHRYGYIQRERTGRLTPVTSAVAPGRKAYYAVAVGRNPGVYPTWSECEAQVKGYSGAKHKMFKTNEGECVSFAACYSLPPSPHTSTISPKGPLTGYPPTSRCLQRQRSLSRTIARTHPNGHARE